VKLLLDTCTFLWCASDLSQLSKASSIAFLEESNTRYLSTVSAWEIAIKYAAGRLSISEKPDIFVPSVREASGIETLEVDEECALLAGRLPRIHSDPFDRMLVAQAIVHGMTILTPDPEIAKYSVRVLW
jgi:PIN domain nuclease of toxin-antitoxin system